LSDTDVTTKADILKDYFAGWDNDLDRAKTLLSDQRYYLEGWLILSCHIGALASLRFPTLLDNESYKRVVLEYSDMADFYEQIDLLFFLQWPHCRGTLVRSPRYRAQGTQDKVSFAGLAMKKRAKRQKYFAVCINNKRYEGSLEKGKLYRVIPDEEAEAHGYLRVVDESGEDYGYSADRFFRLEVPRPLERALLRPSP
jgi:hypothetical protein